MTFQDKNMNDCNVGDIFGPSQVDQQIRGALQLCWMMLGGHSTSVDVVEVEFQNLVDRAIRDFKHDSATFSPSRDSNE